VQFADFWRKEYRCDLPPNHGPIGRPVHQADDVTWGEAGVGAVAELDDGVEVARA
jgi:hypothetical protein